MKKTIVIAFNRLREQLWFRPLIFCILSVVLALMAHKADGLGIKEQVPDISRDSIQNLLDTISASMLVIAIFAVASMLSAFSAASNTATPRSFKVVVKDDVSQNALSTFIGAFIFSIVATIALENGYYDKTGRFILFLSTLVFFAAVIIVFLGWVDRISRLGRLEHTIQKIEKVAHEALTSYLRHPTLKGSPSKGSFSNSEPVFAPSIGYLRHLDMPALQHIAETNDLEIRLQALPGKFIHKHQAVALIRGNSLTSDLRDKITEAFHIGDTRYFDEDPRFGIITLTEIASRALSPGINDPGTAIQVIGSQERLLFLWSEQELRELASEVVYDRIQVPTIEVGEFFNDAFRPIARDGAGNVEVMLRLHKALRALKMIPNNELQDAAAWHAEQAYTRAMESMSHEHDKMLLSQSMGQAH